MKLSFHPNNYIITIDEAGEINVQALYNEIVDWEASSQGIVFDHIVEGSGKVELPDGRRTPICMILKDGWRLASVHPLTITGGYVTGRDKDGKAYHPVVEEARKRIRLMPGEAPAPKFALHAEPGRYEISGTPGSLDFVSPGAVPVNNVPAEHALSRTRLLELKETLDKFHGSDVADTEGTRNTEQAPLSEDDLDSLRAVVNAAIALHSSPTIPNHIKVALKVLYDFLVEMKGRLDKLSDTFDSAKILAFKVGEAALAIKELLDILGL